MDRLTMPCPDGTFVECDPIDISDNDYSKTNFAKVLARLGEYEDAEEQGLLIKLPCKKGDKVWCVDWYWDCEYSLHNCPNPDFDCDAYRCGFDKKTFFVGMREFDIGMLEQFGKTVFLTREEAEQVLRERGVE